MRQTEHNNGCCYSYMTKYRVKACHCEEWDHGAVGLVRL